MTPRLGSLWRGVEQDSWWRVLASTDTEVSALCMRQPQRYAWVKAGEVRRFRPGSFGEWLVPL